MTTTVRLWNVAWRLLAAATCLVAVAPVAALQSERQVYVTAIDTAGQPVTDLSAEEFVVELEGVRQEVLRAIPASEAASVVILTDRLGLNPRYSAPELGIVLKAFVGSLRDTPAGVSVALTTFDGPVIRIQQFGSVSAALDHSLERLSTSYRSAAFLEGLADAASSFGDAPTNRHVVFSVLAAYRPDMSGITNARVAEMLRLSGASLWAIEVRELGPGNISNSAREQVLDVGSQLSGGARVTVTSPGGLAAAAEGMAQLIAAQYLVTYAPGVGSSGSQLTVGVTRPGVAVLAPRWVDR